MNLLITNIQMKSWTGTETYVRDLALGLLKRGHRPMVYSPELGPLAEEMKQAGVPVVARLADLPARPDVIHAHHLPPALQALRRFPDVPALYVQHDSSSWYDRPPRSPQVRAYVAVDEPCRQRLLRHGIPAPLVHLQLHAVNLERFPPRSLLPVRPRRALVFSNYVSSAEADLLRRACGPEGVELDVAGEKTGNLCRQPERMLGGYDLVFAKGLCALEAMIVGTAVILHYPGRLGPLVQSHDLERLRPLNFGRSTLTIPLTIEAVRQQIRHYDAADAALICQRLRQQADLDRAIEERLALYALVRNAPPTNVRSAWLDRPCAAALMAWRRLRPSLRGWPGYLALSRRIHRWIGGTGA